MHEVEIRELPQLSPEAQAQLVMHSFLNILNVLYGELTLLGLDLADDELLLGRGLDLCLDLRRSLASPGAGLAAVRDVEGLIATVSSALDDALAPRPEKRRQPAVAERLANFSSVFVILRVRAAELVARSEHPDRWEDFPIATLRLNLQQVFTAIERHGRQRYRIVYDAAEHGPQSYLLDLRFLSAGGAHLRMPAVFQDVLRDLVANARKYTPPGGRIAAALEADDRELRLVVEDNGRGIPPDEIASVVEFGRRASNVSDVRSMGGGFGLTKALFAAKQFGGRFWIASELGVGTRIRLHVPQPAAAQP